MKSLKKYFCILLSLIILIGSLSVGIYADGESEDVGQAIDDQRSSESASDDSDHLGEAGGGNTRAVVHYYIVEYEDGDMLTGAYSPGTPSMTRYSSGNSNSHYYQKWEVSGNISTSCQLFALAGDRPYTLSVSNSTHSLAIRDMNETGYGDDWKFVSCGISGVYRIQSVNSGTSGQNIYIGSSGLTLSSSNYTMFFVLDYTTYVASTLMEMMPSIGLYIAPKSTRGIAAKNQTGSAVDPNTIKLIASNNKLIVTGNTVTGNSPGECRLTVEDKLTGVYTQCTMTVTEIQNGTYFLKNRENSEYAKVYNGAMESNTNVVQYDFDGSNYEKWQFTLNTDTGYYSIKSEGSGTVSYFLTVKDNVSTLDQEIVLAPSPNANGAKWKVTKSDHNSYIITPKTGENAGGSGVDYVLAVSTFFDFCNKKLIQGDYLDNDSYKDEWYLYKIDGKEVMFVAISDTDERDRVTQFGKIFSYLNVCGFDDFRFIYTDYLSTSNCLEYMEDASVFVSRSHGGHDSYKTWIRLYEEGTMSRLYSTDIYNTAALVNFQSLDIAIFAGCNTAKNTDSGKNLADASVYAGANYAIGFNNSISCADANDWVECFFYYRYVKGYTVEYSCTKATEAVPGITGKCYIAH